MKPYAYQIKDIRILTENPRLILGHDPGLGKTMIAVRALEQRYNMHKDRALIVCSKSAIGTWESEIAAWGCGAPVTALPEDRPAREVVLEYFRSGYLIVNREAVRLFIDTLVSIGWWAIIIDEVHHMRSRPQKLDSKTKEPLHAGRSQFTAAMFRLKAETQWAISATLIDGDPRDAWPTLHWLWKKRYGSFWRWALKYCEFEPDGYSMYGKYVGPQNVEAMRAELAPLILRHKKSEVAADLPPIRHQRIQIELGDAERAAYDAMEDEMFVRFRDGARLMASSKVAQLTRLQQLAACGITVNQTLPSAKLDWIMEYLQGAPASTSIVIASHFRDPLHEIGKRLIKAHISYRALMGGTSNRSEIIAEFQAGTVRVMLITIDAGGESVTLSKSDTMICIDKTWSSIAWEQLINRIHRNDKHTRSHSSIDIISLVAVDTIDEAVETVLDSKQAVNDQIIISTAMKSMLDRKTIR